MANAIFVIESGPSGRKSINSAIDWMNDVNRSIDDTSDLWKGLTPDIKKSVKNEFSEANPNKWKSISRAWRDTKIANGWPVTVGVATGALRDAASDNAKIMYSRHYMQWDINGDISGGKWGSSSEKVSEYANIFHASRRIFVSTMEFIESAMDKAVRKFVKDITSNS